MPSVQLSSRGIRIARSNAEVVGSPSPVPAATQSVKRGGPAALAVRLAAGAVGAAARVGAEPVHDRLVRHGGADHEQADEHQLEQHDQHDQPGTQAQQRPHLCSGGGNRR